MAKFCSKYLNTTRRTADSRIVVARYARYEILCAAEFGTFVFIETTSRACSFEPPRGRKLREGLVVCLERNALMVGNALVRPSRPVCAYNSSLTTMFFVTGPRLI